MPTDNAVFSLVERVIKAEYPGIRFITEYNEEGMKLKSYWTDEDGKKEPSDIHVYLSQFGNYYEKGNKKEQRIERLYEMLEDRFSKKKIINPEQIGKA